MPIYFRKPFKITKNCKITLFKKSASFSVGKKNCKIGFNSRKGLYISGSIPKTGIYGIHYIKSKIIIITIVLILLIIAFA